MRALSNALVIADSPVGVGAGAGGLGAGDADGDADGVADCGD